MGISTTMSHCDLKMFASPQPCDKEREKEREGDGVGERERWRKMEGGGQIVMAMAQTTCGRVCGISVLYACECVWWCVGASVCAGN